MMVNVYTICYSDGFQFNDSIYPSIGDAKSSIRKYIKSQNKLREKPDRIKYDDFIIQEYKVEKTEVYKV